MRLARLLAPTLALVIALPVLASDATAPEAPAAKGADSTAPAAPRLLRGPDCLDPEAVRSWFLASSDTLMVDAGRRKYRLTVHPSCVELGNANALRLRGGPVGTRVCGSVTDAVQTVGVAGGNRSCRIHAIALVDEAEWAAATAAKDAPRASAEASVGAEGKR